MKILVTGASGQLGQCLEDLAQANQLPAGWQLCGMDRRQLDVTDADRVNAAFARVRPDIVVNAAAWTDVDGAERQADTAIAVNALGAANVAAAAASLGARLFHVSTDYVFDGPAGEPITEAATPHALNLYGESKLAGEHAVHAELPDAVVIRTSWLYSHHGRNFVKAMLHHGAQRRVLSVVDDQIGCPTWAGDLAASILDLAQRQDVVAGVYHYAGSEPMSWCTFARRIFACAAKIDKKWGDVRVQPVSTQEYGAAALRPAWTVLSCEKIRALGLELHGPDERLPAVVRAILTAPAAVNPESG